MTALAYRYEDAARVCGVGETRIREAVAAGELIPSWPDSHPRLLHHELEAWVLTWSREKPDGR